MHQYSNVLLEGRYVGYVNWNGLVPASDELAPKTSWVLYVGEHKRASMMPVGGDRFYFFFLAAVMWAFTLLGFYRFWVYFRLWVVSFNPCRSLC